MLYLYAGHLSLEILKVAASGCDEFLLLQHLLIQLLRQLTLVVDLIVLETRVTASLHVSQRHYMCHIVITCVTASLHVSQGHYMCHIVITCVTASLHVSQHHSMCHIVITCVTVSLHVSQHHSMCHSVITCVTVSLTCVTLSLHGSHRHYSDQLLHHNATQSSKIYLALPTVRHL